MKGVGGPLLCIGDLLSDVGEEEDTTADHHISSPHSLPATAVAHDLKFPPARLLPNLFQENYNRLNEALSGTDHSWTALTLELCNALETANNLVKSTNSHSGLLSEKVEDLEKIIKRGDSVVNSAKFIHNSPNVNSEARNGKLSTPDH